jgi:large repetitive protein
MHLKRTLLSLVGVTLTGLTIAGASFATAAAPVNTAAPVVTGYAHVGYTLTTTAGKWTASPTAKYTYQWQDSANGTSGWADVTGATKSSYPVVVGEATKYLRVVVTATNTAGTATANSVATAAVGNAAPSATTDPAITGDTHVGYAAKVSAGVWDANHPNVTVKYQWQLCTDKTDASTCADVLKGTGSSYTPVAADAGKFLRAKVTASNAVKPTAQTTTKTTGIVQTAIANAAPVISTKPALTAANGYFVGQTVKTDQGDWDVSVLKHVKYQWQNCTDKTDASTCADISSKSASSSYKLVAGDLAKFIRVKVSGDDGQLAHAASVFSNIVQTAVANDQVAPAYTTGGGLDDSSPSVGDSVTFSHGTYTGTPAPSFTYQWYQCSATSTDVKPVGCVAIKTATSASYTVLAGDAGKKLRVGVVAKNFVKTLPVRYSGFATVAGAAVPSNSVLPAVTGTAQVGQLLTAGNGTWSGTPTGYTYQWQTSANGTSGWTNLAGATSSTYTVLVGDLGSYLRVQVNASNGTGSGTAVNSAATAQVAAANSAPSYTSGGGIDNLAPADTDLLTATAGTWAGSPAPSFTYQWQSCADDGSGNADLTSCTDIAGATSSTYTVDAAGDNLSGRFVVVVVTGTNGSGSSSQTFATTTAVA